MDQIEEAIETIEKLIAARVRALEQLLERRSHPATNAKRKLDEIHTHRSALRVLRRARRLLDKGRKKQKNGS